MIMFNDEIMRFPPAQWGGWYLLSFNIFFASQFLLEPHIWICIRYQVPFLTCTYFSFYLDKQHLEFSSVRCFFSTQKLQLLCGAKNCVITGVMEVLYFVFVVSFPCNFFCYCGHSTRKGATKKCCQTNNTFEPKKIGRGTDQFLCYHKIDKLSKVVGAHFRHKLKSVAKQHLPTTKYNIWQRNAFCCFMN